MYQKVILYIQSNIERFTQEWIKEVIDSDFMDHYKLLSKDELATRCGTVYMNLERWLQEGASNDNAEQYFESVGTKRIQEGFSLTEINYAFYLTKKILFQSLMHDADRNKIVEPGSYIELMFTLGNYFDLASFYIVRGYNAEISKRLQKTNKLSNEEIAGILSKGSFDEEDFDSEEIIWRHI